MVEYGYKSDSKSDRSDLNWREIMGLYKIMLVDDEEDVREGVSHKINWEQIGFKIVGYAENGQEALELAEKLHPDVLMTDIKMPFMDGLTLCEKMKQMMPEIKLVILSGFDEFEYAQKAIQFEVTEYILKPINSKELTNVLVRIKNQMDVEYSEKCNYDKLYQHYIKSLPIIREKFLVGLMEGRIPEDRIATYCDNCEVHFSGEVMAVAVVQGYGKIQGDKSNNMPSSYENELTLMSIKGICDENLGKRLEYISFIYLDYLIVIAMLEKKEKVFELLQNLNLTCEASQKFLNVSMSAGIGYLCEKAIDLSHSYEGAKVALEYRVLSCAGPNKAIYILDVEPGTKDQVSFGEQDLQKLIRAIKLGEIYELKEVLKQIIDNLSQNMTSIQQYQIFVVELIADLFKFCRGYEIDLQDVFKDRFDFYHDILKYDSLDRLSSWLLEKCLKIQKIIQQERMDSVKLIATKTKQYISEYYFDPDLSVDMMCSELHVSAAYFSTIFKKETGMSFVTYLTKVRLEEAIRLLNTTDEKTYVISSKVGYLEPNYFSYVFKKHFGISPMKYRIGLVEND